MLAYSFQEQKSTLLALIWGYFTGKQDQILPTPLLNLKKKFQPIRLFQPTRLLESWEYVIYLLWINCSECGDKGVVGEVTNVVDPLDIEVSCPITELKLWPICFNLL